MIYSMKAKIWCQAMKSFCSQDWFCWLKLSPKLPPCTKNITKLQKQSYVLLAKEGERFSSLFSSTHSKVWETRVALTVTCWEWWMKSELLMFYYIKDKKLNISQNNQCSYTILIYSTTYQLEKTLWFPVSKHLIFFKKKYKKETSNSHWGEKGQLLSPCLHKICFAP